MKQISRKIIVIPRIWNEKHKAYLDDDTFSGKILVFLFDEIRAKNNKTIRSFFFDHYCSKSDVWISNKCLGQDLDM